MPLLAQRGVGAGHEPVFVLGQFPETVSVLNRRRFAEVRLQPRGVGHTRKLPQLSALHTEVVLDAVHVARARWPRDFSANPAQHHVVRHLADIGNTFDAVAGEQRLQLLDEGCRLLSIKSACGVIFLHHLPKRSHSRTGIGEVALLPSEIPQHVKELFHAIWKLRIYP